MLQKCIIVKRYSKNSIKGQVIAVFDIEETARYYVMSKLTEYEKEKTNEKRQKGNLTCDGYYSKQYTYILVHTEIEKEFIDKFKNE